MQDASNRQMSVAQPTLEKRHIGVSVCQHVIAIISALTGCGPWATRCRHFYVFGCGCTNQTGVLSRRILPLGARIAVTRFVPQQGRRERSPELCGFVSISFSFRSLSNRGGPVQKPKKRLTFLRSQPFIHSSQTTA
jgi:hypothetical protein